MHTILVPVDGSPSCARALEYAIRQVQRNADSELLLVHVQPPVVVYGEIAVYAGDERARAMAAEHSQALLAPAEQAARDGGVAFRSLTVEGDIAEGIADTARDENVESVIMGTRGLGRVAALMMGSVAVKVVHLVEVPVTLVK